MPDIFLQLCRWFHQDFAIIYDNSIENAISSFIAQIDASDKATLKKYIGDLLNSGMSGQEFGNLWSGCGAEFYFSSGEAAKEFFQRVINSL